MAKEFYSQQRINKRETMADKKHILVINGPNLNLLGTRERQLYGATTLAEIETSLRAKALSAHCNLFFMQSNAEHEIINTIHDAAGHYDFILINPAAFTHTSVAIRDALLGVAIPFIEVHLSNIHAREPFRRHSYVSDCAVGVICGFGAQSYELALTAALEHIK